MDHTPIKMNHLKCNGGLCKIKYFNLQVSMYSYVNFICVHIKLLKTLHWAITVLYAIFCSQLYKYKC
jgi:hypothetical protein